MPIYVALLRGINLGPHKRMKMERLRASFEDLKFKQVQTYIQSGNVVFEAGKESLPAMCSRIENKILSDFGFPAPVVLRTAQELKRAITNNPFVKRSGIGLDKLHVIFLPEVPGPDALKELQGLTTSPDESSCLGKEIYLFLPNGMSKSSLINNRIERRHLKGATTRNWQTVNNIHEICQGCE